jgi:hypothetical protein
MPLDIRAAAASMLARSIASEDAREYFGAVTLEDRVKPLLKK